MAKILPIVTVALLLAVVAPYTLEGEWTLVSLNDRQLSIPTSFSEFIYRGEQVVNKLTFHSCKQLLYQVDIEDDNFYVRIETEWLNDVRQCGDQQLQNIKLIREWIRRVLKFTINIDRLTIADPSKDPVFSLQRKVQASSVLEHMDITGQWIVSFVNDPKTSHVMIADGHQISICSGALFNYSINHKYYIGIEPDSQGLCKNLQLLSDMNKGIFYQKYESQLQVFDNRVNLVFSALLKPGGRRTIPKAPTPIVTVPEVNTKPTPETGFASGQYFTLLLFGRGLGRKTTQVTSSTITMELCSKLVFDYKIRSDGDVQITSASQIDPTCPRTNEKLFFDTMLLAVRYSVDQDGDITLIADDGKDIVALTMK